MAEGNTAQHVNTWELTVETPHTERVGNSAAAIQVQMKLAMLGDRERNDVMGKQIQAFREKVRLCRESYSPQLAESMICQIRGDDGSYIDSIYKLKKYVQNIPQHQQQHPAAVYAVWYLNNLAYLKELKTNFDTRIYLPLTKLYQAVDSGEEVVNGVEGMKEATNLSEHRLSRAPSILRFKNDLPEVKDLYDFTEVENIASRLGYIRQRWQFLLDDENEISSTLFSYNSQIELSRQCPRDVANILRLVPDILLKCGNAASLSLQWLECACTKVLDLQTTYSKLERVKTVLTEKLTGLSEEIRTEEGELEAESTDLEMLADREERANEIMSKTHQIDYNIQQLKSKILELTDNLTQKRRSLQSGLITMDEATQKYFHSTELQILKLQQEIKVNQFEKKLLNEDLSIEMEVKPCMIRFTDQAQEKCENLEQKIDSKKTEKQQVELALVPVMADSRRTEAEISRVNSVASTPQHTTIEARGNETNPSELYPHGKSILPVISHKKAHRPLSD